MVVLSFFRPQARASKKITRERKHTSLMRPRRQAALTEKLAQEFRMLGPLLQGNGNIGAAQYLSFLTALQLVST
jgi:hypothetical protein